MRKIGFCGGSSLCELGSASDVELFFDCIEYFAVKKYPHLNWTVLTDRLYRRYLRYEEIVVAEDLMRQVQAIFTMQPSSEVNWKQELVGDTEMTLLDPNQSNLGEVFSAYFERFHYCVESAQVFMTTWKIYQPIKTVPTDLSGFAKERTRPPEDYDSLSGKPFWLC